MKKIKLLALLLFIAFPWLPAHAQDPRFSIGGEIAYNLSPVKLSDDGYGYWIVDGWRNWVTAFNFDWGYKLEVLDAQGATVASIAVSGRDVVDAKDDQSPQNMLKLAFRDRLIKILERPELRAALQE